MPAQSSCQRSQKLGREKNPNERPNAHANPAKAAPAKEAPAAVADVSSKGDAKGKAKEEKGKGKDGKGKGKGSSREDKAKTPCVFFQMPSGCVHGSSCAYLHEEVKAESSPGLKAEPKPKPKTSPKPACKGKVMAAVAIVAALSSMAMPAEGCLEFAADTGAGRHLVSLQALERQGIHHDFFDRFVVPSSESLRFTTGGGNRDSSDAIGLKDKEEGVFKEANHFVLESCPFVRLVGLDISSGMGFLWLPNQLPCYIKDCSKFQYKPNEENRIRATRVELTFLILLGLLTSSPECLERCLMM